MSDETETLRRYLASGFRALRWKLDGLPECDLRRPLVPTGTNLLGIVKHVAAVSSEYFGVVFERPSAVPAFGFDEPNIDMWATAEESSEYIVGLLDSAAAEADATLAALPLDAPGHVPWWGDNADATLQQVAVHMVAELHRHTGQADIVRELIDGQAGLGPSHGNLPDEDADWWASYRARLQAVADSFH